MLLSVRPSVCPSVAYIANNSRTQRPSVPKFGNKVPNLRCDSHTSFKVKWSKSRLDTGGGIPCRPNPADTLLVTLQVQSLSVDLVLYVGLLWKCLFFRCFCMLYCAIVNGYLTLFILCPRSIVCSGGIMFSPCPSCYSVVRPDVCPVPTSAFPHSEPATMAVSQHAVRVGESMPVPAWTRPQVHYTDATGGRHQMTAGGL